MDPFVQKMFVLEIGHQCDYALRAYTSIRECEQRHDVSELFYHLQNFLVSSANVSKMFFAEGARGTKAEISACQQRAEDLRALLGVDEASPLRARDLRNDFEHFDERLQKWAERPGNKNYLDNHLAMNTTADHGVSGIDPNDAFRVYVTPPPAAWFWGTEYPLQPLVDALEELKQKIAALSPGTGADFLDALIRQAYAEQGGAAIAGEL